MRNGPDPKNKPDLPGTDGNDTAVADTDENYKFPTARGVLTSDEIAALLRPQPSQGALEEPHIEPQTVEPKATVVFEETSEPDPDLQARQVMASRLSMALGKGTGIKASITPTQIASLERSAMPGLLHGKSSAVACMGRSESDIRALICLPPELSDAIIAKACGSSESTGRIGDGWVLSAIDCALLEQLLEPFGAVIGTDMRLQSIETDIPYVTSLLPIERVTITEFRVEAVGLHTDLAVIDGDFSDIDDVSEPHQSAAPVTALATARLASLSVPLSRVTALRAGSTLLLGLPPDQPVELLSGGRDGTPAYEGRMGRKGNKVAIKVTKKLRTFKS
ncbi:MAG: FliM/FliN family flagellar motor switch protein [Pseudomonadota bacterium]